MKPPGQADLFQTLDATWPAARFIRQKPWVLRKGSGGGQRVSSATAAETVTDADIVKAEAGMRDLGQHPLFMLRPGDDALENWLAARNYDVVDPVAIYLSPLTSSTALQPTRSVMPVWPPSDAARVLWAKGGIGPDRIAVMERVQGAKIALHTGTPTEPTGVTFVALHQDIAMLHALEVSPSHRRNGIGRELMSAAATWSRTQGADWLSLMVTRANAPANALYRALGMSEVGRYHYRRAPMVKP